MMRILLVRHGESEWNSIRRLQGQSDIELTERGRGQAADLAPTIARLAPSRVATSDLKRARDTAALLGHPQAEPRSDLREHDLGEWSGLMIDDLKASDGEAYRGWRAGRVTPPGGETWDAFRARTAAAVRELAEEGEGPLLVVCHGGVIRALLESFLGITADRIIPVGPASLTILAQPSAPPERMRLELFNFSPRGPVLDAPD